MMTDEQVKKGLEQCSDCFVKCRNCPYSKVPLSSVCVEALSKDALALINRLEEENRYFKAIEKDTARIFLYTVANIVTEAHQPIRHYQWFKDSCKRYGIEVEDEL